MKGAGSERFPRIRSRLRASRSETSSRRGGRRWAASSTGLGLALQLAGIYENKGTPHLIPQIAGFPYHKDPNKVPLISETPL